MPWFFFVAHQHFSFVVEFGKETSVGVSNMKSAQILDTIETLADKK